jgi:hypothetical protein
MKTFKQYITEVISFVNNSSWALSPLGFEIKDSAGREHPDHFPHLDFMGRSSSQEKNTGRSNKKIPATSWGRVDHDNKVIHIITQNGMITPKESLRGSKLHDDVFARLDALKHIRERFPEYRVHAGGSSVGLSSRGPIITHGYSEHERYLTDMIKEG